MNGVTLFKKPGAKYIVSVFEHHDGFAMYNKAITTMDLSRPET